MPLPKASPAIWKKFTRTEKAIWRDLYAAFSFPENFHTDWTDKKFRRQREVVAHNLACETVWYLALYLDHWVKVMAKAEGYLLKKKLATKSKKK